MSSLPILSAFAWPTKVANSSVRLTRAFVRSRLRTVIVASIFNSARFRWIRNGPRSSLFAEMYLIAWMLCVSQSAPVIVAAQAFAGDDVLVAPGVDDEAVIDFLQSIIEGRRTADAPLDNVFVHARQSFVTKDWTPGMSEQTASSLPPPEWHSLVLVQKNGKRRYEQEVFQKVNEKSIPATVYRLIDGNAFYFLNVNSLDVSGINREPVTWSLNTDGFSFYDQVHDGAAIAPMCAVCQTYIDRLNQNGQYFLERNRILQCRKEDRLLVVDLVQQPGTPKGKAGYQFTFWVDPDQGYHVVKSHYQLGAPGRGLYSTGDTVAAYKEIAPGVFFVSTAMSFFRSGGTVAEREKSAGWGKRDLVVTDVQFGDFAYDEGLFDAKTLPVPIGAYVTDYRTDPPLVFRFGREPLNEQILNASAKLTPKPSQSWGRLFFWLNVSVVALAAVVIGLRWLRGTRQD